ncbi:MAG: hypothetical protein J6J13_05535 [Clostridia bacterium]|nr:hypothetical protein [Clostridia bacterium]
MQNSENNKLYDAIIASSKGKIDKNSLDRAKSGDLDGILSSLSEEDAKKLKAALADKEKTKQLLSSDAAKALMNMLMGGKNNG